MMTFLYEFVFLRISNFSGCLIFCVANYISKLYIITLRFLLLQWKPQEPMNSTFCFEPYTWAQARLIAVLGLTSICEPGHTGSWGLLG